jgi:hypothetical protein
MTTRTTKFVLTLFIILSFYAPISFGKEPARIIAGWVEKIRIENQDYDIKAKLDTGAKTSSIYAINIEPFKKGGKRWAKFTLLLVDSRGNEHKIDLERPRSRKANIKNHDGNHDQRYVVDLGLCFNGRKYVTEFTLTNRSEYIYGVLLGREFIGQVAIIDPDNTFLTTSSCEMQTIKVK